MEYYIYEFFVSHNYQNKGVGKSFIEAIGKRLLSKDIHDILVLTKRNYPAQAFYESIGFKVHDNLIFYLTHISVNILNIIHIGKLFLRVTTK